MAKRKYHYTATLPDGHVKRIGPTTLEFTHYWRIVATLPGGGTDVFWGHSRSLADVKRKRMAAIDAARNRGWTGHIFDIVALEREPA